MQWPKKHDARAELLFAHKTKCFPRCRFRCCRSCLSFLMTNYEILETLCFTFVTYNTSILFMRAVMASPTPMQAFTNVGLVSHTCQVIQPDSSCSFAEIRLSMGFHRACVPQLLTHHVGIAEPPSVITNSPPGSYTVYLYASLKRALYAIYQANIIVFVEVDGYVRKISS